MSESRIVWIVACDAVPKNSFWRGYLRERKFPTFFARFLRFNADGSVRWGMGLIGHDPARETTSFASCRRLALHMLETCWKAEEDRR